MIFFIEEIFYKIFRFFIFAHGRSPILGSCGVFSLLIFFPIGKLLIYISNNCSYLNIDFKNMTWWQLMPFPFIVVVVVLFYFNKNKVKEIVSRHQNERKSFRKITDILFILFLIIYCYFMFPYKTFGYSIIILAVVTAIICFVLILIDKGKEENLKKDNRNNKE